MNRPFFQAEMLAREMLTPGMLRLTFGGAELASFTSTGKPDEYLRLFFPNEATGKLHLPVITETGRWTYPDGQDAVRCSTYTIRNHRPERCEIDIDFVIHEGGVASDWAQKARVGERITINRPIGLYTPPTDSAWQLLVADATGLPALCRILEQTPPDLQSRVFIEIADSSHQLSLPHHDFAEVTWLHRSGNGIAPSRMADMVRNTPLPATPGYIWVAGEQKVVRAIRKYVRQDLKLPPERYELVGYWTENSQVWESRWQQIPQDVRDAIDASWSSGRDPEELRDEYYATLEKYGL